MSIRSTSPFPAMPPRETTSSAPAAAAHEPAPSTARQRTDILSSMAAIERAAGVSATLGPLGLVAPRTAGLSFQPRLARGIAWPALRQELAQGSGVLIACLRLPATRTTHALFAGLPSSCGRVRLEAMPSRGPAPVGRLRYQLAVHLPHGAIVVAEFHRKDAKLSVPLEQIADEKTARALMTFLEQVSLHIKGGVELSNGKRTIFAADEYTQHQFVWNADNSLFVSR